MEAIYVAIDFDGTIVYNKYPGIGKPIPYAIEYIKKLQEISCVKLLLYTMRSEKSLQEAIDFSKFHAINWYGINTNPTQKSWTNSPKAYAQYYIDDHAVGCPLISDDECVIEQYSSRVCQLGTKCCTSKHKPAVDWSRVGPIVLSSIQERIEK